MRKHLLSTFLLGLVIALPFSAGLMASAADVTGTWSFSVDLENGGHGEPTFTFKQDGENLTGTYSGPLGDQKVTGIVKGAQAVSFDVAAGDRISVKVTYTGTIESQTKMSGTVEFSGGPKGKWTATKK